MRLFLRSAILALAALTGLNRVQGQVTSAATEAGGATVIVVYATDPAGATIGTQVVQTVTGQPGAATTTSTAVITPAPQSTAPSVVGPDPPTTYTYTTFDENGNLITVVDIFTPTYKPTTWPISKKSGSILAYSDYTRLYGNPQPASALRTSNVQGLVWAAAVGLFGIAAGARLIAAL
ncbi:hypothetical protein FRC03_004439 [Tulasnella sp. 419]|nr:hypothetical protein FRC02_002174 [Tulasnella sp. 418]KAG8969124.1 hypothetical protein FRC03_004439 [Tulasnella sp. 419]